MIHLALLRAINVGKRKVLMADLKACLVSELGYADARTYIQTGNVLFTASGKAAGLEKKISGQLGKTFGFDIEVIIRTAAELKKIAEHGPFSEITDSAEITRYVTFLKQELSPEQRAKIDAIDNPGETHRIIGKEVYSELDRTLSENLVFSGNFIDKKLKSIATARNWKVVRALAEMVGNETGTNYLAGFFVGEDEEIGFRGGKRWPRYAVAFSLLSSAAF